MTIYNPENLNKLIQHHQEKLASVFSEAGSEIDKFYTKTWHLYNASEKAMLRNCHLRNCAKRIFDGVDGASWKDRKGIGFKLYLDGISAGIECLAELKLKKVNKNLVSSNIPTRAVKLFNTQQSAPKPLEVQNDLFGGAKIVSEPAHLIAGYTRNPLDTAYERLVVTFPTGMRSAELILELSSTANFSQVVQIPLAEINETAPRVRVRRKTQIGAEEKTENQSRIVKQSDEKEIKDNVIAIRNKSVR